MVKSFKFKSGGFLILAAGLFSLAVFISLISAQGFFAGEAPLIKSLSPTYTAEKYETEFKVDVSSSSNTIINSYEWDFNGKNVTKTTSNKIKHTFNSTGTYTIEVVATDINGFSSSESFQVEVSSQDNFIQTSMQEINLSIKNLKADIQIQDLYFQTGINSVININSFESQLDKLEQDYSKANSTSDYEKIISSILGMKVPKGISKTIEAGSFVIFPEKSSIRPSVIESVAGGTYEFSKEADYQNGVLLWHQDNIDAIMSFTEFSAEYDSGTEPVISFFGISIQEKNNIFEDYYLFVPQMQGLEFNNEAEKNAGSFVAVNLRGNSDVKFHTTENIDFSQVNIFISPSLNSLDLTGPIIEGGEQKNPRKPLFYLSLFLLFIIAIVVYIILQQWYKKRYEDYLFKNKNDLYNIVSYVNNSRLRGLTNKEIEKNLRKAKWNPEQIIYVMKKYTGKRTGMIELPFTKFLGGKKKEHEPSGKHHEGPPHHPINNKKFNK